MNAGCPRFEADRREREELAARFFGALAEGVEGLRELLAADIQIVGDGPAAHGLTGRADRAQDSPGLTVPRAEHPDLRDRDSDGGEADVHADRSFGAAPLGQYRLPGAIQEQLDGSRAG